MRFGCQGPLQTSSQKDPSAVMLAQIPMESGAQGMGRLCIDHGEAVIANAAWDDNFTKPGEISTVKHGYLETQPVKASFRYWPIGSKMMVSRESIMELFPHRTDRHSHSLLTKMPTQRVFEKLGCKYA